MSDRANINLGFLLGLATSLVFSYIVFINNNPGMNEDDYFKIFFSGKLIVPVMSISLLANFALFFIFLRLNKDAISKGLLIATVIIGTVILLLRFM